MLKGIDVSKHDGVIDWKKAKDSGLVDFAVIRAGYGRLIEQKDKKFESNYQGCKENNIPCGAYWYSYAHSVAEIQTEARVFLEVIKGKQFMAQTTMAVLSKLMENGISFTIDILTEHGSADRAVLKRFSSKMMNLSNRLRSLPAV